MARIKKEVAPKSQQLHKSLIVVEPSHSKQPTSDPRFFRFVDQDGDWKYYWDDEDKVFRPALTYFLNIGYPKGERFHQYLLNSTKEEAEKKLQVTGERGTIVHDAIAFLLSGGVLKKDTQFRDDSGNFRPLKHSEWQFLPGWVNWVDEYQPQTIIKETTVRSRKFDFCGTLDWFGTILVPDGDKKFPKEVWGKRILSLLDWKTSSGIWNSYKAQVAGLVSAAIEMGAWQKFFVAYPELFTGIVRVGTKHTAQFEFKSWSIQKTFAENLMLLESARKFFADEFSSKEKNEIEEMTKSEVPVEIAVHIDSAEIPQLIPNKREEKDVIRHKNKGVLREVHGGSGESTLPQSLGGGVSGEIRRRKRGRPRRNEGGDGKRK